MSVVFVFMGWLLVVVCALWCWAITLWIVIAENAGFIQGRWAWSVPLVVAALLTWLAWSSAPFEVKVKP